MLIGLAGLLVRRIVVDRVRYISSPSDYLMLLLILGIAATGMNNVDLEAAKQKQIEVKNVAGYSTDSVIYYRRGK